MKKIATAFLIFVGGIISAVAADLPPVRSASVFDEPGTVWSGPYIGIQAGYGISNHKTTARTTTDFAATPSRCFADASYAGNIPATEDDPRSHDIEFHAGASVTNVTEDECKELLGHIPPSEHVVKGFDPAVDAHSVTETTHSTHSDSGLVGGLRAGYDQVLIGKILVGGFGEFNWSNIEGKNHDWLVGVRAGITVTPSTLIYGLVGYGQSDYDFATFSGWSVGGGVETAVVRNVFLGLEYRHSFYGSETVVNTPALQIRDKLDEDVILGRISYKFDVSR